MHEASIDRAEQALDMQWLPVQCGAERNEWWTRAALGAREMNGWRD
jgi:hypothetical protein